MEKIFEAISLIAAIMVFSVVFLLIASFLATFYIVIIVIVALSYLIPKNGVPPHKGE